MVFYRPFIFQYHYLTLRSAAPIVVDINLSLTYNTDFPHSLLLQDLKMPSMYEGTPSGSPLEPSFPELRRPASTPSSRSRPSTPSTRPDTPSTLTPLINGLNVRLASRNGELLNHTSGLAPSCLQANLIILPSKYAEDFRLLCKRNPVPCPLLAESESAGRYDALKSYIPGLAGKGIADDVGT